MHRVTILDRNNIPRCWAEGSTYEELVNNAVLVASDYALKRPDCVPFSINFESIKDHGVPGLTPG